MWEEIYLIQTEWVVSSTQEKEEGQECKELRTIFDSALPRKQGSRTLER